MKRFDLPATEVTDEIRNDMKVLQIRNHIFKDRFYKKADPLPKYFQIVCFFSRFISIWIVTHAIRVL